MADGVNPWNRALVTGASSGIGRDLCKQLAAQGTDLIIVARNTEQLESLAEEVNVDTQILAADLSVRDEVEMVAARLADEEKPVDLLINCAGFGHFGSFVELAPDGEAEVVEVNVIALQQLTHAAAKVMKGRGRGWILNVSSIAGFAPYPRAATYAGTKAFVTNFSESLYGELAEHGVVVSSVCPGPTKTDFQSRAKVDIKSVPDQLWQESDEVAREALNGLKKKKPIIVPGGHNKILRGVIKLSPDVLVRKASGFLSSKGK